MKRLNDFPYSHVLVLGLAKSGTAAAELLLQSNIKVCINDKSTTETDDIVKQLREKGAEVIVGSHPTSVLDGIDLIVKNPGIPYNHPLIHLAIERNIRIVTEIELAYLLAQEHHIIGITGSNGKTTTTMLVYEMMKQSERLIRLAGNIGIVATEVAQQLKREELLLLELSSFQLLGTEHFRPHIACLLNLYDAHLDYHGSVNDYEQAKARIFINQMPDDFLIYNKDDQKVCELVQDAQSTLVPFSTKEKLQHGAWTDNVALYFKDEKIILHDEVSLVGSHNIENMLAAIAIAKIAGATTTGIQQVLKSFSGVKHRLQFVKELNDRYFYNDSKATNTLATQKALQSFQSPTILLAGGLDRGEDFNSLIPFLKYVKACVLFGESKEKLEKTAKLAKIDEIHIVHDVEEATKLAYELSKRGDTILLSPACASWDQYSTFEERGDMFIETVHTLS